MVVRQVTSVLDVPIPRWAEPLITSPNNGIFVSTYAKTVGDHYRDFGSQN